MLHSITHPNSVCKIDFPAVFLDPLTLLFICLPSKLNPLQRIESEILTNKEDGYRFSFTLRYRSLFY